MENINEQDRMIEEKHLEAILSVLNTRLSAAKTESENQREGLNDIRRDEFQERSEPVLRNLWAAHRFEDLVHLSQEFQNAAEEEKDHASTLRLIFTLQKMIGSPYFARVDLAFDEDEPAEEIYIGRQSLWDDEKENLLVYDWRSPIASVFYRYGTGPAAYMAPAGKISCRMLLKRQYEIQKGQLIGYFDADTVIQDSFLRRMLAQNASSKMKAIVETIQKDQDAAIRDEEHDLLMVQGAAGSGKTSIAMHRVAYLMYEGLKNPLKPHHILILSPNTVFEKYISGVLPELGESSVATSTLEGLLEEKIGIPVQSRLERWELLCAEDAHAAARREALEFKSSPAFIALLDRLAEDVPNILPYQDLSYAGRVIASREEIAQQLSTRSSKFPLAVRMRRMEDALWQRVHALRPARLDELRMMAFRMGRGEEFARGCSIWESGVLAKAIHSVTRMDFTALYQNCMNDPVYLKRLGYGLSLPQELSLLRFDPQEQLALEDAAAIAYLQMKLTFGESSSEIRQVVVDEAQDYSAVDYAVLNRMYPKASFTVVGDVHQRLGGTADLRFYDMISGILSRRAPVLLTLNKSFRCTREILDFSLQFLPDVQIESLNRSGAVPKILYSSQLGEEIAACRALGYESVALITKTAHDAEEWLKKMNPSWNVRLMGRHAQPGDVFLVPLPLSKGLEFDSVLLLDCDESHYGTEEARNFLYIACTRALHRLALFCDGEISPLIRSEV
ncbi:MAG: AAA family ATPase [Clostridia bacterium]|nr:AAA family ATPase [Clostridia bacterium]